MTAAAATAPPAATVDERTAEGRAQRAEAPRSRHGEWSPEPDRPDPVALLEEQGDTRVAELLPIRYGRMAASPFSYYRGAAYAMAWDLAKTPTSGIRVQLCGDAHLSNFGGFASPERELLFDLNDFDETLPGPFEWDVKRLAASIDVAGRARGFSGSERRNAVRGAVEEYRTAMQRFAEMNVLDVWYAHIGIEEIERRAQTAGRAAIKRLDKAVAKAKTKDSARAYAKLTHAVAGGARIVADPPLIVPMEDLVSRTEAKKFERAMHGLVDSYVETLPLARRRVIGRYRYVHAARKLVGVGSVGTRAWVVLMLGRDDNDPLFLQAKEAQPSVLAPFAGDSEFEHQGQRVVEGQRLMQAQSDMALGWVTAPSVDDGKPRDFYVRQLWDWKTSAAIELMSPKAMAAYGRMCGWTLARAHACSGEPAEIAGYLGSGESFDRAITQFAESYADQNERDHRALVQAIDDGRIDADWDL